MPVVKAGFGGGGGGALTAAQSAVLALLSESSGTLQVSGDLDLQSNSLSNRANDPAAALYSVHKVTIDHTQCTAGGTDQDINVWTKPAGYYIVDVLLRNGSTVFNQTARIGAGTAADRDGLLLANSSANVTAQAANAWIPNLHRGDFFLWESASWGKRLGGAETISARVNCDAAVSGITSGSVDMYFVYIDVASLIAGAG